MTEIDGKTARSAKRHDRTRIAAQFCPSRGPKPAARKQEELIGVTDVKMQASKTVEPKQDSKRQHNELDSRYGKIGISAVAAALRHLRERQTISEYRIPFDRD
jgi:hypothetical protein